VEGHLLDYQLVEAIFEIEGGAPVNIAIQGGAIIEAFFLDFQSG